MAGKQPENPQRFTQGGHQDAGAGCEQPGKITSDFGHGGRLGSPNGSKCELDHDRMTRRRSTFDIVLHLVYTDRRLLLFTPIIDTVWVTHIVYTHQRKPTHLVHSQVGVRNLVRNHSGPRDPDRCTHLAVSSHVHRELQTNSSRIKSPSTSARATTVAAAVKAAAAAAAAARARSPAATTRRASA